MRKKALRDFRHNPEKLRGPEYSFLGLSGRTGIEFIAMPVDEKLLRKFGRELASLEARMSLYADALDSEERGLSEDDAFDKIDEDITTTRKERRERARAGR